MIVRFGVKENRRNKLVEFEVERCVRFVRNKSVRGILEVYIDDVNYSVWMCGELSIDVMNEEMLKGEVR